MKLLACLASGLSIDEIRWVFRQDDGWPGSRSRARHSYAAYEAGDPGPLEDMLADDFTFFSPRPTRVSIVPPTGSGARPNAQNISGFEFERLVEHGDEVFVTYEAASGPQTAPAFATPRSSPSAATSSRRRGLLRLGPVRPRHGVIQGGRWRESPAWRWRPSPTARPGSRTCARYLEVDERRSLGQIASVVVPYLAVWVARRARDAGRLARRRPRAGRDGVPGADVLALPRPHAQLDVRVARGERVLGLRCSASSSSRPIAGGSASTASTTPTPATSTGAGRARSTR